MAAPSSNFPPDVGSLGLPLFSNTTSTMAPTTTLPQSNHTLPHITAIPNELLTQIVAHLEDPSLVILSLTCHKMRDRIPQPTTTPFLEAVALEFPSFVDAYANTVATTTQIRLWSLLKEYMHPRIYAGNYGVHKFLALETYKHARKCYWQQFPCIPPGILPNPDKQDQIEGANSDELADLMEKLGFRFEGGRNRSEQKTYLFNLARHKAEREALAAKFEQDQRMKAAIEMMASNLM